MKMSECIDGLFQFLEFKSNSRQFKQLLNRNKVRKFAPANTDPVIRLILRSCSNYASSIIVKSYRTSIASNYKYIKLDNYIKIDSIKDTYYTTDLETNPKCTCLASTSMLMPCKHIFYLRRVEGLEIFDESMINLRWKKNIDPENKTPIPSSLTRIIRIPNLNAAKSIQSQPISSSKEPAKSKGNSRFAKAHRFLQELAGTFVNDSEALYLSKLQQLCEIKEYWENNVSFNITPIDTTNINLDITGNTSLQHNLSSQTPPPQELSPLDPVIDSEPLSYHSDPLSYHSEPLSCHSETLSNHSEPLSYHSEPLSYHSEPPNDYSEPSILAGKKLLKVVGRGRKKDSVYQQQAALAREVDRDVHCEKLLRLILINKARIPEILAGEHLIDEQEILVKFDKLYSTKLKLIKEFKQNLSYMNKYFTIDGLSQLDSLINF